MTDSTIERARVLAGLQEKLEVLSKKYHGVERRSEVREEALSRTEALTWCVDTLSSWPIVNLQGVYKGHAPRGWTWMFSISAGLHLHRFGSMNIGKKTYDLVMAELERKDVAITQEEFTGVTPEEKDVKKYVYKVKLFKVGEDSKGLSVAGESMGDVISTVANVDYLKGWEIIAISRGSVIDIL